MIESSAAAVKQLIDDLDSRIETARHHSLDLVARLLDMARLELLMQHHGIDENEFEAFCDVLAEAPERKPQRRPIAMGSGGPRRPRGERAKPRRTRRTATPAI
jgi:hypothetical protein